MATAGSKAPPRPMIKEHHACMEDGPPVYTCRVVVTSEAQRYILSLGGPEVV
jgi:hypothetical protein